MIKYLCDVCYATPCFTFFAAMQTGNGLSAYIGSSKHRLAQLTTRAEQLEETAFKKPK
jgi:hypothetical protein